MVVSLDIVNLFLYCSCKRVVQNNKQLISALQRKAREVDLTSLRVEQPEDAVNARWTDQELLLGVQGDIQDERHRIFIIITLQESECMAQTFLPLLPSWGPRLQLMWRLSSIVTT